MSHEIHKTGREITADGRFSTGYEWGHTGSHVWDLEVRASRPEDSRRTTHYGVCRCGWMSRRRTSAATVVRDYYAHLAATDDPNAR